MIKLIRPMPSTATVALRRAALCTASTSRPQQQQQLDEALAYCVQIVRERDYEQYLGALMVPLGARARVFTILALNAEVATLRHKIKRGSGLAGINQLTFWRDSLQMLGENGRKRLLPRQPVITALSLLGLPAPGDLPLLLNLVTARQQTLGDRPFASVQALEQHARLLHASLMALQMRALRMTADDMDGAVDEPFPDKAVQVAVDAMACAVGILTLIRATVLLLRDGVLLLPRDLTELHGVNAEMAYRNPNCLKPVVRDLVEISAVHLQCARSPASRAAVPAVLRPALLTSGLRADYTLHALRSGDCNLLDARLHRSRQALSAWKLWWRLRRGRY